MKRALLIGIALIFWHCNVFSQPIAYPCQYDGNTSLMNLVGTWDVEAKDRLSPGNYESNTGISIISNALNGCSIQESYRGVFKGKSYAVEATLLMTDSMQLQRVYYDSEHANVMVLEGEMKENNCELIWLRNPVKKKMQVKFQLEFPNKNAFEWTTHLTTDYGETWQLTHHWQYTRESAFNLEPEE